MNTQPNSFDDGDEVVNQIFKSCDYRKFELSPFNRDVKQERKDRLYAVISKKNLTIDQPLTVERDPKTGKLLIIEGQGRFLVNRELEQPIYYKFAIVMVMADAPQVAAVEGKGRWFPEDQLKVWVAKGHPSYIALKKFWNDHDWLSLTTSIKLVGLGNMGGPKFQAAFDAGQFNSGNILRGVAMASMIKDFQPYAPFLYKNHMFVDVIRQIMMDPNYDHKRMIEKMEKYGYMLTKQGTNKAYFEVMNVIYNHHARGDTRYEFKHKGKKLPVR